MIVERMAAHRRRPGTGSVHREELEVRTCACLEFVDVTDAVAAAVERSGIADGLVSVQSLHTTAAVVVNEDEPLLLEDLRAALERAAPCQLAYRHDETTHEGIHKLNLSCASSGISLVKANISSTPTANTSGP